MASETELKFRLEPGAVRAAWKALGRGRDEEMSLLSVYFDTAEGDLRRAGFSLRIRTKDGAARTLTLKSIAPLDGVFGRGEWEAKVADDTPDLAPLGEIPAKARVKGELVPRFAVGVRRAVREVRHGKARIEAALDAGSAEAGERSDPICELELELKDGPVEALFDLAARMVRAAPLRLCFVSKADRGFALLGDGGRAHFAPPGLTPDLTAGEALQAIGRACLVQLTANAESLRQVPGPEGVHQLRIAVRRLRSAISTFKPLLGDRETKTLNRELKWLAGEFDAARELDVFMAGAFRPAARARKQAEGLAAFGEGLQAAQASAYGRVGEALDSDRYRRLALDTAAWLQCGRWTRPRGKAGEARETPVADFAAEAMTARLDDILNNGKALAELSPDERHKVRIAAKKLRYAAEDFEPLFDGPKKPRKTFIKALKDLQGALGELNDLHVGGKIALRVAESAGPPAAAWDAGRLAAHGDAREAGLVERAVKAFKALADAEPFW